MERRTFVKHAAAWATAGTVHGVVPPSLMAEKAIHKQPEHAPMELGLLIKPSPDPEAKIRLVHDLGFKTCFLSSTAT
jgi:L-ribulose-5-phosphate 3-epimerase